VYDEERMDGPPPELPDMGKDWQQHWALWVIKETMGITYKYLYQYISDPQWLWKTIREHERTRRHTWHWRGRLSHTKLDDFDGDIECYSKRIFNLVKEDEFTKSTPTKDHKMDPREICWYILNGLSKDWKEYIEESVYSAGNSHKIRGNPEELLRVLYRRNEQNVTELENWDMEDGDSSCSETLSGVDEIEERNLWKQVLEDEDESE
jgi:hypothetical protein